MLSRRAALVFGVADLLTGAVVGFGVFVALPARWWPVDAAAGVLTLAEVGAGIALVRGARRSETVARAVAGLALGLGLLLTTLLGLTASWLSGVYGPVGAGGGIILTLVAVLAIPYVVVLPAVQLVWLGPRASPTR